MPRWSLSEPSRCFSISVAGLVLASSWSCAGATRNPDGPGVSVPHEIAAGRNDKAQPRSTPAADGAPGSAPGDPAATADSGAPADSSSGPPAGGYAPDPEPLRMEDQWDYTLTYRDGAVVVDSVEPIKLEAPVVTVRRMGRFAIELWVGSELLERVRFDFPLVGTQSADDAKKDGPRPMRDAPRFQVEATLDVRVPASPRATRAVLVDRATGKSMPLAWPPEAPIADPGQSLSGPEKTGPAPKSL